jgi:hypothetical protein
MPRIAAAMLIVAAVLAFHAMGLSGAWAKELTVNTPVARAESVPPIAMQSAKVLSLLLVLESLRIAPISLDGPKS